PRVAHVASFDPADGLQRFISALAGADGNTLVMVGATNPRTPPRFLEGGDRATFPVPAGHRGFLAFRSADAASTAESAQFVSSLTPHAVASFYRGSLAAQGYRGNVGRERRIDADVPEARIRRLRCDADPRR